LALARTAAQHGALLINYCRATELIYEDGKIAGLQCQDVLTGQQYPVHAACVVNATGVWVDAMRAQDGAMHQAAGGRPIKPMVAPSQGVHIVVDQEFLETQNALIVPKTEDGRVLFAVPWLGKVILGTTDTPRTDLDLEPLALAEEMQFILREAGKYLCKAPIERDIRSIWVGLRPLVKAPDDDREATKTLSREHTILVSRTGLVTVTGGKWTTYRAMAQDVIEKCLEKALLQAKNTCQTETLALVGVNPATQTHVSLSLAAGLHSYGDEASFIQTLPGADNYLSEGLSEAMVRFAARYEYAITVEDVLARRSRLLFLDAALASQLAAQVAQLLQSETGIDPRLSQFLVLAKQYLQIPSKNI
jgi:glycerol-3-phosphate dehydrogenase